VSLDEKIERILSTAEQLADKVTILSGKGEKGIGNVKFVTINGMVFPTVMPPFDKKTGLFIDPGPDGYNEQQEEHNRQTAMVMAFYAEFGPTFDPLGRYLCGGVKGDGKGGCNKFRPTPEEVRGNCTGVGEGTKDISGDEGSCQFFEIYRLGDHELQYPVKTRWSKSDAGYGERPKPGKGFGCWQCGLQSVAKGPDSMGRTLWCGQHAMHVTEKACCEKNHEPGDIWFSGNKPIASD
jgi:hypothetical protein